MRFQRQTHCHNGHPLTGGTKLERVCRACLLMRLRRHRLNDTPQAKKARATKNAWRKKRRPPPKPREWKPPGTTRLAVCRRGHDRTDPLNVNKAGQCLPCRRIVQKSHRCDEPVEDMRRGSNVLLGEPL